MVCDRLCKMWIPQGYRYIMIFAKFGVFTMKENLVMSQARFKSNKYLINLTSKVEYKYFVHICDK